MQGLFNCVDRVGMDVIAEIIKEADGCKASKLVRQAFNM